MHQSGRLRGLLKLWLGGAGILLWLFGGSVFADTSESHEYQVKAAFLYKLAKFIEWPATAFRTIPPTLTICILGADPFGPSLDRTIKGQTVSGVEMIAVRLENLQAAPACHMLFISSSERGRLGSILEALKGARVLTVGDTEGFIQLGGMINLYVEKNTVRFQISEHALDRPGWKISSKLLNLGKIVTDKTGP
jgi:hypothetical protein